MSSSPALRPTRLDETGGTASQFLSHSRRRQRGWFFHGADKLVDEETCHGLNHGSFCLELLMS